MPDQQCAADVMMIRPVSFYANSQTAETNRFQDLEAGIADAQASAVAEFNGLAEALRQAGVLVHVFEDSLAPAKPDALFPNNWISFHADGTVVLYPMLAPNRRLERRNDILESLSTQLGYRIDRVIDFSALEQQGIFLEGTGSLVLDRRQRRAYACLSARTNLDALGEFAQQLDYEPIAFEASDEAGAPIYHTNVLLSVGSGFAAICTEAIRVDQRDAVLASLQSSGHKILDLSFAQIKAFAGNILELQTSRGPIVALSASAADALTPSQRSLLVSAAGPLISAPIPTIERLGGGSVRCMLAEVFLPRK